MQKLTAETLKGIWAAVPLSWDEEYGLDEDSYRANIERMCGVGVHGIYTTGSTGEFYALSVDEFKRMADIQDEICGRHGMPLQIGCCSDCTWKTLELLEYAAAKPNICGVQTTIPYWMELTDREMLQFFRDVHAAVPEMPIIHYNIIRSKRHLNGPDYLKVLEVCPNLIGVKYTFAGSNFGSLQETIIATPQISYFVADTLMVSAMLLGARGCCSSMVQTDPAYMLTMYDLAENGRWEEAVGMQKTLASMIRDLKKLLDGRGEGMIDPVVDKGIAIASGCFTGSQRTRPPYIGWSDDTVAAVREFLQRDYPQFIYPV